ncbi:hypothetical protein [Aliikangiella coralliicola]|uniref:MarR family transcriptional regulator n=1 Tax=Aliikangiella coralliicola TaxID=2592383 RepID=A0A545U028_9GAMM|nr:hypothetical protein [Aliikangiella coralliicola]TQV82820.1 hypothetical protein FLL46_23925 [Aliikangiella coralliicola]
MTTSIDQMRPGMKYTPQMLAKQTGMSVNKVKGELKSALMGGFVEETKVKGQRGKYYETKQIDIFN